ncbi:citrate lyase acyl carrier protein [Bombilactobacillus thymidiniphilus]|uniref:Citrate lyase acyl carrier protein n=1 Tax=Bombilactobacillus thymidiniphilus TaxID=2923363 RepID=A0ABY4PBL9_9LACO|nr:citrate lyase acyl carrier protein [Bombilactobacillus thymidiniphilus]UQS83163.1 citrate lyase acyl carrier protein [Bombilactobacillus thymidiniphilus]
MEIKRIATAGTLESSDIQITIAPGNNGLQIELQSDVIKQFGAQIKQTIIDVLTNYGVQNAQIKAVDKGALDLVIKARAIAAVQRALEISEEPRWEVL